jgi:hypothetical protein
VCSTVSAASTLRSEKFFTEPLLSKETPRNYCVSADINGSFHLKIARLNREDRLLEAGVRPGGRQTPKACPSQAGQVSEWPLALAASSSSTMLHSRPQSRQIITWCPIADGGAACAK